MIKISSLYALLIGFFLFVLSHFVIAQTLTSQNDEQNTKIVDQQTIDEDKSWLVSFIENMISTPDLQIKISNLDGALSSNPHIDSITIADRAGIWLKLTNVDMDWSRLALIRARLSVETLSAERIDVLRKPLPTATKEETQSNGLSIPNLPLAINVQSVHVKTIALSDDLLGLAAQLSVQGSLMLDDGDLKTKLKIQRLDAQGLFDVFADIAMTKGHAKINVQADEPDNGLIANILKVENRPAIKLRIDGDGQLDNLLVNLAMQTGAEPVLNGQLHLSGLEIGHRVSFDLNGPISPLMPSDYRSFFGNETSLHMSALLNKTGNMDLEVLNFHSGAVNFNAQGALLKDGFLRRLKIDAKIANPQGGSLILPVSGGTTRVDNIALNIDYGGENSPVWKGRLIASNFANANFNAQDITFDMGGVSKNLDDPALRHVGVQINGGIHDITTTNSSFSSARDSAIKLIVDTDIIANQPIDIRAIELSANGLKASIKGFIEDFVFKGDFGVQADSLDAFALVSGQPLEGALHVQGNGTFALTNGAFNFDLNGTTQNIKTGVQVADGLLQSNLRLSGGIMRNARGITTRNFMLGNDKIHISANGFFSSVRTHMDFGIDLADLGLIDPRMQGPISLKGAARGHNRLMTLSIGASVKDAMLASKKMQNTILFANLLFDNTSPYASYLTGSLDGRGEFASQKLLLAGQFDQNPRGLNLQGIDITLGDTRITADVIRGIEGLMNGHIKIDAPDISTLAALALSEGQGSIQSDIVLKNDNNKQNIALTAQVDNLNVAGNKIKNIDVQAALSDLFGQVKLDGHFDAKAIHLPNFAIESVNARSQTLNGQTNFSAATTLEKNMQANLQGALVYPDPQNRKQMFVNLNSFAFIQNSQRIMLKQPARISFLEDGYKIDNFLLDSNGGTLSLDGIIGQSLNLRILMNALPVSLANLVMEKLGASGTLSGKADIKGTLSKPDVAFNLKGQGLTIAALREKNVTAVKLNAKGQMEGNALALNANLSGGGLDINAEGKLPLGAGNIDIDVSLNDLPLALVNGFVDEQNLGGRINGRAHIGGLLSNPSARFNFAGEGLTANIIASHGLAPIQLAINGSYNNSVLNLEKFEANGPQNLNLSANGRIPVSGNGLDLYVRGGAPLAIANQILAERGAQISGSATVDATVKGSFSQPQLGGNLRVTQGTFIDAATNLRLNDLNVQANLNGDQIVIENVSASSSAGGNIRAKGTVSTNIAAQMPANIAVQLNHLRYSDGAMIVATVDGTLSVTGSLLRDPLIGGDLTIEHAEISVPDRLGGAALINVKHKNLTQPIETTLERAQIETRPEGTPVPVDRPSMPQIKMRIRAPNQIFVRGMGLDVELGGGIGLIGPANDIHPIGGFQMLRGRFDILSQRLDFSEGNVTLTGNFNPEVHFVATSQGSDITVTITVSGLVDALDISFSSTPELPKDEVLARLIFNRSIGELSPFQIAQLASAAAELAGVTNTSLLGALRSSTGLDDLDLVTDAQGNTGVRAGRYIRDNIYLGVEAGSGGNTKGTVNLDISKNMKARGALGSEGDSSVGVFYEKDY
ncbi:translocation/assembly module TamB domain-containing protein [Bartonella tamiae]|uniref:Translocation and assembly module TamB C-terminal domain-containing protein n=1 Tax=Bartonella tamiae Th239 TaxID=1094558 RepID=J0R5X7_9HYPH|nr:translocation/assembly module TamB domain-containing protein [Bartonella tamiae]EJF91104.1 hypothetical protein ME5_00436 [Bartonella tamiae Th239]EJF93231.1 hypothetical protein MEG_01445 [Bartonella tamiae Th307]